MPKSSINLSSFILTKTKDEARQSQTDTPKDAGKEKEFTRCKFTPRMADSGTGALGNSDTTC